MSYHESPRPASRGGEKAAPAIDGSVAYLAVHQGQLAAGLLLLLVGIPALYIYPGGLFYFVLPLPSYVWTSVAPLFVGSVLVIRALLLIERVSISRFNDVLRVAARGLITRCESISMEDARYVDIRHLESKVMRWLAAFGLFLLSYEIHFKNGMDLLGYAGVAPFLLLCFVVVCAALAIFIATPRQFLEFGTGHKAVFVPLPGITQHRDVVAAVARLAGFHGEAVSKPRDEGITRSVLKNDAFALITSIAFIAIGLVLMSNAAWFFGDVAVPAFMMLGAKWLKDVLVGDKTLVKVDGTGQFRGYGVAFVTKRILGGNGTDERVIGASTIHPLEILVYFYLMAQAVKHGFRFVIWPYLGFNPGYFILGIFVVSVVFFKWFGLVDQHKVDFGSFSIRFSVASALVPTAPLGSLDRMKWHARDRIKRIGTAFKIIWGDKRRFWMVIAFAMFVLVPILYYSLSYPPFIF
ncbi:MAG: hypothetical protein JW839_22405 [Candidatus Lokiarchaeota archaeon]|nr:hypothetical protein [Candidatus Lokiarchaeota archaeon]